MQVAIEAIADDDDNDDDDDDEDEDSGRMKLMAGVEEAEKAIKLLVFCIFMVRV